MLTIIVRQNGLKKWVPGLSFFKVHVTAITADVVAHKNRPPESSNASKDEFNLHVGVAQFSSGQTMPHDCKRDVIEHSNILNAERVTRAS